MKKEITSQRKTVLNNKMKNGPMEEPIYLTSGVGSGVVREGGLKEELSLWSL